MIVQTSVESLGVSFPAPWVASRNKEYGMSSIDKLPSTSSGRTLRYIRSSWACRREPVEGCLGIDSNYPVFKERKSRAFSERACPGDVYSWKSTQAIGAPGKTEKLLFTSKVTTNFSVSPCTPRSYASFLCPTEVFRMMWASHYPNTLVNTFQCSFNPVNRSSLPP